MWMFLDVLFGPKKGDKAKRQGLLLKEKERLTFMNIFG